MNNHTHDAEGFEMENLPKTINIRVWIAEMSNVTPE